jgi:hypothetical protein
MAPGRNQDKTQCHYRPSRDRSQRFLLVSVGTTFRTDNGSERDAEVEADGAGGRRRSWTTPASCCRQPWGAPPPLHAGGILSRRAGGRDGGRGSIPLERGRIRGRHVRERRRRLLLAVHGLRRVATFEHVGAPWSAASASRAGGGGRCRRWDLEQDDAEPGWTASTARALGWTTTVRRARRRGGAGTEVRQVGEWISHK